MINRELDQSQNNISAFSLIIMGDCKKILKMEIVHRPLFDIQPYIGWFIN